MESTGLAGGAVVVAVLAASSALGLWRRRRDGTFRPVADPAAQADGAGGPLSPQGGSAEASETAPATASGARPDVAAAALRDLGVPPGSPATLLQFSSAFCAPCRVTRRLCGEVATLLDGVHHLEVDAESHLDAVRALDVWRTPTVLVVDGAGRIVSRSAGQPSKAQLIAAVAPLLTTHTPEVAR